MSAETMEGPSVSASEASISVGAETSIVSEISPLGGLEFSQTIPAPLDNFSFDTPVISEIRNPFPEISYPTISVGEEPDAFPVVAEPWGSISVDTLPEEPDLTIDVDTLPQIEPLASYQPTLEAIAEKIIAENLPQAQIEIEQVIAEIVVPKKDLDDSIVDILTLSPQTEEQANLKELQKALTQTQELGFTQEEQKVLQEKLVQAALTKTQVEPETETENQVEPEVEPISDEAPPDDSDNTTNSNENEQDEPEEEELVETKEPSWDETRVDTEWELSVPSLKKRQRLTQTAVDKSFSQTQIASKDALQGELLKLDIADVEESIKIATHNLKYPQIAADAQLAVQFTESENPRVIAGIVQAVVANKPPEEKHQVPVHVATVKQSELDPEPKALANDGAEHIIFKNVWKPVKKTFRKEIWELDKQKAV